MKGCTLFILFSQVKMEHFWLSQFKTTRIFSFSNLQSIDRRYRETDARLKKTRTKKRQKSHTVNSFKHGVNSLMTESLSYGNQSIDLLCKEQLISNTNRSRHGSVYVKEFASNIPSHVLY